MLPYVFSTTPVGQTIRRLRKERGLTQEELAEQLGVTAQAVSKWENETGMPDISQIVPLAGVFGVIRSRYDDRRRGRGEDTPRRRGG